MVVDDLKYSGKLYLVRCKLSTKGKIAFCHISAPSALSALAKGTVYLHFPSREDLVVAIFERDIQKFGEGVKTIMSSSLSARDKIGAILQFMYGVDFNKRMQLLYSLMNTTELRRIFLEKKASTRDMWDQLTVRMTSLLEEGKAAGEFDKTLPTAVMLSAFYSLF